MYDQSRFPGATVPRAPNDPSVQNSYRDHVRAHGRGSGGKEDNVI